MIEPRRPDIVVVDKIKKETMILDVTIPGDTRVCDKQMKKVVVIPIVVEALGTVTTKFEKYIERLGIEIRIKHVHKSALLGTARIIRKVLSC